MENEKISVTIVERVDNLKEHLFYNRILDILTEPDGPKTCKLLSELSATTGNEDEKNG